MALYGVSLLHCSSTAQAHRTTGGGVAEAAKENYRGGGGEGTKLQECRHVAVVPYMLVVARAGQANSDERADARVASTSDVDKQLENPHRVSTSVWLSPHTVSRPGLSDQQRCGICICDDDNEGRQL